MARRCEVTGKGPQMSCDVSRSHHKTKRRSMPNLQRRKIWVPSQQRFVRALLSTEALRLIDKLGADSVLGKRRKQG